MTEVLIGLIFVGAGFAIAFVLPVISFARSTRAANTAEAVRREIEGLRAQIGGLRQAIAHLERSVAGRGTQGPTPAPEPTADAVPPASPASAPAPAHVVEASRTVPDLVTQAARAGPAPLVAPLSVTPSLAPSTEAGSPPPFVQPPYIPGGEPGAARPSSPPASHHPTLEERIGGRWLLYVALASLLLGVSYFIKYAFDNDWVTPLMRVGIGALSGLALVEAGRRFAVRGLGFFGQTLTGGGVAILYLSVYSAYAFYDLTAPPTAFALLVAVTAFGAVLADRQSSQGLAMLAVMGGFASPFLVSTGRDAQVALFTYAAILVAGTMYLARRQRWPLLNLASFVLTGATLMAWAVTYYRPSKWLVTELFLTLFAGMFVFIQRESWRLGTPLARGVSVLLAFGPLLYHVASLGILFPHPLWLLVYLIAFTAVGVMIGGHWDLPWVRVATLILIALPFLPWIERYRATAWVLPGTIVAVAIYAIHLLASLRAATGAAARLPAAEVLVLHGNGGWLCGALVMLYQPHALDWLGSIAGVLAAWNGLLALGLRRRVSDAWVHHVALAFALGAVAVAQEFDGAWATVGWAAEGFALVWISFAARRPWLRAAGGVLLVIASTRLSEYLLGPPAAGALPLANARAAASIFVVALLYGLAWLFRRHAGQLRGRGALEIGTLLIVAQVLSLMLLTAEIDAVFQVRAWEGTASRGVGAVSEASVARQVAVSTAWATYALALVAVGIRTRYAPIRYFAIGVFAVTILKVFLVDLAQLDRIWRILSFMALGLLLLLASYLYQRFALGEAPGS